VAKKGKKFKNRWDELDFIRSRNKDDKLIAKEVVAFAEDLETHLHRDFLWDNDKAGHRYRLQQARQIIVRANIRIEKQDGSGTTIVQSYVSEPDNRRDRKNGGGYTLITTVIKDKSRYEKLLEDAKQYIKTFRHKYSELVELNELFEAIDSFLDE